MSMRDAPRPGDVPGARRRAEKEQKTLRVRESKLCSRERNHCASEREKPECEPERETRVRARERNQRASQREKLACEPEREQSLRGRERERERAIP